METCCSAVLVQWSRVLVLLILSFTCQTLAVDHDVPFQRPPYHPGQEHTFGIMIGLILTVGFLVVGGVLLFVKFCSSPYQVPAVAVGEEPPPPPRFVLFPRLQRRPSLVDEEQEELLRGGMELPDYDPQSVSVNCGAEVSASRSTEDLTRTPMVAGDVIAVLTRVHGRESSSLCCHGHHRGDGTECCIADRHGDCLDDEEEVREDDDESVHAADTDNTAEEERP